MTLQTPIVVPYCYQVTGKRLCESSTLPYDATGHLGGPSRLPGSIPIKVPTPTLLSCAPISNQHGMYGETRRDCGSCYWMCQIGCSVWVD
ncbi:uncharacterized protein CEXT_672371 [Caerostris extrusa]|uniref:Uncharacterized protein n=1 Tax=Caerostris extrusa TaxID=172846 RepID=A0AAV4P2I0_CAEEX|nr:uncharacterized protein CEXT_672371 [Caerostris extrusa]